MQNLSRREMLKLTGMAAVGTCFPAPGSRAAAKTPSVAPVAIGRCRTYGREMATVLDGDRKSTRLNSSHIQKSRMPSSA